MIGRVVERKSGSYVQLVMTADEAWEMAEALGDEPQGSFDLVWASQYIRTCALTIKPELRS